MFAEPLIYALKCISNEIPVGNSQCSYNEIC